MLRNFNILLPLLALAAALASCSPKLTAELPKDKLERRKTNELVAAMDSISRLRPNYFYSKIKCEFSDTNQRVSFKTSLRVVRDSVVNPLITKVSLPIIKALIRPDSVIVVNMMDNCVIRRNLGFIKEQFGVGFDYRNVEELLLGLPVGFDTTQKYFQIHDPHNYIVSSHRKRKIRRELRDNNKPLKDRGNDRLLRREDRNETEEEDEEIFLKYYLSDDIRSIKRIFIDSPNDTTTIEVEYISRDSVGGYLIPKEVRIVIVTPRNRVVVEMNYDKSAVDTPQEIYFVIPEGYEECSKKE